MKKILILLLLLSVLHLISAELYQKYKSVLKTRIDWNNGQLLNYHDYEQISVCCEGYIKVRKSVSHTKCEPICRPSCPINTHCIRPNVCECNEKYRGYTGNALTIQCEPICVPNCSINAKCIAPNQCQCKSGYQENFASRVCRPICKTCPENSECTQPDQCTCNAGYLDNGLGECKPVCGKPCPQFAECTKPEICSCQQNYEMIEGNCQPICEQECPANSQCTKPNVCECRLGYKISLENVCQPVCENASPQQESGMLSDEPNEYTCDNGYEMLEQHCQPVCEKACPEHASCSEPNKCQCEAGYQFKSSTIYDLSCEPVCQPNCSAFGKCMQPNKCECLEGYEMDELEMCQPICSGSCKNGFCFQPEICICNPGYLMGPKKQCEPVCLVPCQNGSCVEPEICQCHEGYKFRNNSINICEPICEPQCINGICVGPNVCICRANFEPISMDNGLDHHNCQEISNTTITSTTQPKLETNTMDASHVTNYKPSAKKSLLSILATVYHTSSLQPYQTRQTSASTLVSADTCNDRCHCWQEFDEYGTLVSKQCVHLCADAFDKLCLDLNRCQCDVAKNHLICHASNDSLEQNDDLVYYMCNEKRFKAFKTFFKPQNVWLWVAIAVIGCFIAIIAILCFKCHRKLKESQEFQSKNDFLLVPIS